MSTSLVTIKRSTKGVSRLSSWERKQILMPNDIKDVLIGILLGDAHIVKRSSTGNSRLVYAQTAIAHKAYFEYVYSFFNTFCAISFTTMQLPCFNVFRKLFYLSNVKTVPINIYELLTPKGLAFLIMDDASKHGTGLHINVYAFSYSDVDKLMFALQDKFNLKCSIHYNRDNKPRIYLFKKSMDHLITLVKPYFINEMLYKLGL